jgi:hypothetical protein
MDVATARRIRQRYNTRGEDVSPLTFFADMCLEQKDVVMKEKRNLNVLRQILGDLTVENAK